MYLDQKSLQLLAYVLEYVVLDPEITDMKDLEQKLDGNIGALTRILDDMNEYLDYYGENNAL